MSDERSRVEFRARAVAEAFCQEALNQHGVHVTLRITTTRTRCASYVATFQTDAQGLAALKAIQLELENRRSRELSRLGEAIRDASLDSLVKRWELAEDQPIDADEGELLRDEIRRRSGLAQTDAVWTVPPPKKRE